MVFGEWTMIGDGEFRGYHRYVECVCSCGKKKLVRLTSLLSGETNSCRSCSVTKHGMGSVARGIPTEYRTWANILQRCHNPQNNSYGDYGGRGIFVHDEWRGRGGFEKFLSHIGKKPSPELTIERIDNDRGYEPGNVRWATRLEQRKNRRVSNAQPIRGHGGRFVGKK